MGENIHDDHIDTYSVANSFAELKKLPIKRTKRNQVHCQYVHVVNYMEAAGKFSENSSSFVSILNAFHCFLIVFRPPCTVFLEIVALCYYYFNCLLPLCYYFCLPVQLFHKIRYFKLKCVVNESP